MREIHVQVVGRVAEAIGSQVRGKQLACFVFDIHTQCAADCFDVFVDRQPSNKVLTFTPLMCVNGGVDHVE